ncbi:MAG TPA: response regulator transcription factor [Acidimicrobiales bacterium]
MGPEPGITVLVVDDQAIYHDMVRRILDREPDMAVVAVAATMREALDRAETHRPDVVLMDQQLPDGRGTDAAGRITALVRTSRVVMVTATANDLTLEAARAAGCSGYVLKDRLVHDLPDAVRAAHRGEMAMPDRGVDLFLIPPIAEDDEALT